MNYLPYQGTGTYKPNLDAKYDVYLPTIAGVTYKFTEKPVYNFSKGTTKRILIFMEMIGAKDIDLTNTTGVATSINFSISPANLQKIDSTCPDFTGTEIIEVVILHDDEYDLTYAKNMFYNKTSTEKGNVTDKESNKDDQPKKFGMGTLRPV